MNFYAIFQQRDRADKLVEEAKGGAKPTTPMKRRLGTTAIRTQMESPKAKQRKMLVPSVRLFGKNQFVVLISFLDSVKQTAPQQRPTRRVLTEALVNQLPQPTTTEADASMMSTYSAFTVSNQIVAFSCVLIFELTSSRTVQYFPIAS